MENLQQSPTEPSGCRESETLEQCLVALLEKDRLNHLSGFIQGLIHNINGPLQNMSMLVEVLLRGQDQLESGSPDKLLLQNHGTAAVIQKQGKRLDQLNQQIAVLANMLRGFMVLHEIERNETEVDLNLLLNKLSEVFRADLFYKHHVSLNLQLTKNLPLIRVYGRHIVPALVHLLKNAVYAMRTSPEKKLTIQSLLEDGRIRILVRDTGCGLPQGVDPESLFDLFHSKWQSRDELQGGENRHLGLGLYAARRLLGPYGGEVSLGSVGGETVAVVEIPFPGKDPGESEL